ncbi:hypothetical protein DPMN_175771, partial [Dreissena polymorpha]
MASKTLTSINILTKFQHILNVASRLHQDLKENMASKTLTSGAGTGEGTGDGLVVSS